MDYYYYYYCYCYYYCYKTILCIVSDGVQKLGGTNHT